MFASLQADGRAPSSNDCRKNEPKIGASTKVRLLKNANGNFDQVQGFFRPYGLDLNIRGTEGNIRNIPIGRFRENWDVV